MSSRPGFRAELGLEDDDSRFCERCAMWVTPTAKLEADEFEALIDRAAEGRVCVRLELDHGRPKLASGLASALTVALIGCTSTQTPGTESPPSAEAIDGAYTLEDEAPRRPRYGDLGATIILGGLLVEWQPGFSDPGPHLVEPGVR